MSWQHGVGQAKKKLTVFVTFQSNKQNHGYVSSSLWRISPSSYLSRYNPPSLCVGRPKVAKDDWICVLHVYNDHVCKYIM